MGRAHVTLLKLSWQLRRSCRGTPAAAAAAQYNVASVPRPAPPRPAPAPHRHNFLPIKVSPARRGPAAAVVSPPAAGPQQPAAEHCGRTAEAEAGFCGGCGAAGRSSCWAVRRLGRDIPGAPSVDQSECESSGVRSVLLPLLPVSPLCETPHPSDSGLCEIVTEIFLRIYLRHQRHGQPSTSR